MFTFASVKQLNTILLMGIILISTLSLSIQSVYKSHFCTDTKSFLTIAGKSITTCGKTCRFNQIKSSQINKGTHFAFNFGAPPLFFEQLTGHHFPKIHFGQSFSHTQSHYLFDYHQLAWQPPRFC